MEEEIRRLILVSCSSRRLGRRCVLVINNSSMLAGSHIQLSVGIARFVFGRGVDCGRRRRYRDDGEQLQCEK